MSEQMARELEDAKMVVYMRKVGECVSFILLTEILTVLSQTKSRCGDKCEVAWENGHVSVEFINPRAADFCFLSSSSSTTTISYYGGC